MRHRGIYSIPTIGFEFWFPIGENVISVCPQKSPRLCVGTKLCPSSALWPSCRVLEEWSGASGLDDGRGCVNLSPLLCRQKCGCVSVVTWLTAILVPFCVHESSPIWPEHSASRENCSLMVFHPVLVDWDVFTDTQQNSWTVFILALQYAEADLRGGRSGCIL